jgi:hypothetical protein
MGKRINNLIGAFVLSFFLFYFILPHSEKLLLAEELTSQSEAAKAPGESGKGQLPAGEIRQFKKEVSSQSEAAKAPGESGKGQLPAGEIKQFRK